MRKGVGRDGIEERAQEWIRKDGIEERDRDGSGREMGWMAYKKEGRNG